MKKLIFKIVFIIISVSISGHLYSQEYDDNGNEIFHLHLQGLQYGFNFGSYFPNNKVAAYYNGEPGHALSLTNTIGSKFIVDYANQTNYSVLNSSYQNISNSVFHGDSFKIYSYPLKMKYTAAVNIGFHARYNFTDRLGIYFEINYSKLRAQGEFSMMDLNGYGIQSSVNYSLLATETRVDMNLGMTKSLGKPGRFMPYVEAGLNLNNTSVLTADALVENGTYSYLNPYYDYLNKRYGGIGNGALLGGGIQIIATPTLILNTGIDFSLKKIHLGNNSAYSLNTVLYIRILFYKLITTKPEA